MAVKNSCGKPKWLGIGWPCSYIELKPIFLGHDSQAWASVKYKASFRASKEYDKLNTLSSEWESYANNFLAPTSLILDTT